MSDAGTMTIRVEADTNDVERGLKKVNRELAGMQINAAKAQRNAARASMVASATTVLGTAATVGMGVVGTRRTGSMLKRMAAGAAVSGGARAALGGGMRAAVGGAMGGLAGAAGPLLAVAGMAITMKLMLAATVKILALNQQQADLMVEQTRTAIKSRRSLQESQSLARAKADPFARSMAFHRSRSELGATAYEQRSLAGLAETSFELSEATRFKRRAFAAITSPYQSGMNQIATAGAYGAGRLARFQQERQTGLGGMLAESALGTTGFGRFLNREKFLRSMLSGGDAAIEAGRQAEEERYQQSRQLASLERLGPGGILNAPGTVRAGDESEYAFRVTQQRRQLNREAVLDWQNKVLAALEKMVELGTATPEDVESRELAFGRGLVGVD